MGFCVWVFVSRQSRVIRVAQPRFLVMIAASFVVMAARMIPLSMDDLDWGGACNTIEERDLRFGHHCRAICMGVPWLSRYVAPVGKGGIGCIEPSTKTSKLTPLDLVHYLL